MSKTYTYWPRNGAVYEGQGMENLDLTRYDASTHKLGHIQKSGETQTKTDVGGYVKHASYKIKYGSKTKTALMALKNGGKVAAIGDNSIDHINAFPLLREMVGTPAEVYFLEEIPRGINVPSLNARIPERGAFKAQLGVKPLQEVDFGSVKYGEDNFNLTYNATPFFHPTEDRLRGVIDPMNIDMSESQRALREARNVLVIFALTGLTDTDALGTNDWSVKASGANTVNPKKDITKAITDHWTTNQSRIDKVAINPIDYQRYEANDNVKGFQPGLDVVMSGVVPMRGIPGLTAYLDPMVPLGRLYFVDSQALLKGMGPLQTEQWREPKNNSDLGIVRDYVQILLMNPARYGFKADIDVNTTDGDTAGTEPATLEAAKALIGDPTTIANPPTISS